MSWGPPTQAPDRRSSEWDAFVDTQPAFAHPRYRAGFRQDLLCDKRRRASKAVKAQCQSGARRGFHVLNAEIAIRSSTHRLASNVYGVQRALITITVA
jgi:hypothetical protein